MAPPHGSDTTAEQGQSAIAAFLTYIVTYMGEMKTMYAYVRTLLYLLSLLTIVGRNIKQMKRYYKRWERKDIG